jgi:hypothetical protein
VILFSSVLWWAVKAKQKQVIGGTVPKSSLLGHELLPLLRELTLHPEFNFAELKSSISARALSKLEMPRPTNHLLFLTAKLVLLETNTLAGEVLGEELGIPFATFRIDGPRELLGTVGFVQDVLGEHLEVTQMGAKDGTPQANKIRVVGVIDFNDAPRVDSGTDWLAIDFDLLFGAYNGERQESLHRGGQSKVHDYIP